MALVCIVRVWVLIILCVDTFRSIVFTFDEDDTFIRERDGDGDWDGDGDGPDGMMAFDDDDEFIIVPFGAFTLLFELMALSSCKHTQYTHTHTHSEELNEMTDEFGRLI